MTVTAVIAAGTEPSVKPATAPVSHGAIASAEIDSDALLRLVDSELAGAVTSFFGVVRNHDVGRAVVGIDYSAHPSAPDVLSALAEQFAARPGVHAVAIEHRVGSLGVGDVALFAAVSASHRSEAFAALSELVDQVKTELPVWKKQYLADSTYEWSQLP